MKFGINILKHALGADDCGNKKSNRNYYVTSMGRIDYAACKMLESMELMKMHPMSKVIAGGDDYYIVTQKGMNYLSVKAKKRPLLSKSSKK